MSTKEKEVGLVLILLLVICICVWFMLRTYSQSPVGNVFSEPSSSPAAPTLTEGQKAEILDSMPPSKLSNTQKNKILQAMSAR